MNLTDALLGGSIWFNKSRGVFPQKLYDYNGGSSVVYVGFAPRGAATSAEKWIIYKLAYDVDGNLTSAKPSADLVKWDDRTTTTYS